MSTQQAATSFSVHERTIRRFLKSGKRKASQVEGLGKVHVAAEIVMIDGQSVMDNARAEGQDARLLSHLTDENKHLRDIQSLSDETIESLTREISHLTQR